jgi:hypothetical protein
MEIFLKLPDLQTEVLSQEKEVKKNFTFKN